MSRGLGDVYKRQIPTCPFFPSVPLFPDTAAVNHFWNSFQNKYSCVSSSQQAGLCVNKVISHSAKDPPLLSRCPPTAPAHNPQHPSSAQLPGVLGWAGPHPLRALPRSRREALLLFHPSLIYRIYTHSKRLVPDTVLNTRGKISVLVELGFLMKS